MTGLIVARRYAKALVELASDEDLHERVGEDLRNVQCAVDASHELKSLLNSPVIAFGLKKAVLAEITARLDVARITADFLNLLLEKGRIKHLAAISFVYEGLIDEKLNRVKAFVRTKYGLTAEEETALKRVLSSMTGKEVVLCTGIDPSIIGGLVAQIGGTIFDGSIKGQLKLLKEDLMRSTNYHGT